MWLYESRLLVIFTLQRKKFSGHRFVPLEKSVAVTSSSVLLLSHTVNSVRERDQISLLNYSCGVITSTDGSQPNTLQSMWVSRQNWQNTTDTSPFSNIPLLLMTFPTLSWPHLCMNIYHYANLCHKMYVILMIQHVTLAQKGRYEENNVFFHSVYSLMSSLILSVMSWCWI